MFGLLTLLGRDSSLKWNDLLNIPQQKSEDGVQENALHSTGTLTGSGFLSCSNNIPNSEEFIALSVR